MKIFLLLLAFMAETIVAFAQVHPASIKTITIESRWGGLGKPADSRMTIIRAQDGSYHAGKGAIPGEKMDALLRTLNESPLRQPEAENLGITRAWLLEHVDEAGRMSGLVTEGVEESDRQKEFFRRSFLDEKALPRRLKEVYEGFHTDDYPSVHIVIATQDGKEIELNSRSQNPYMVPWAIKSDGAQIETFNAHISSALRALLPKSFANWSRLAHDDKYSDGLLAELSMHIGWELKSKWAEIGAEDSAGDALSVLKEHFAVDHSEVTPYHDFYFGKSWDEKGPHEENLHAALHDASLPANIAVGAILLRQNGHVEGLDGLRARVADYEGLVVSIGWLNDFFKSHPKEKAWLIYVHDRSLSPKAMRIFAADMKAAGHPELIQRVDTVQEQAVLLESGAGDFWILLPDKSVILWRRASLRPVLKWPYTLFDTHECADYGISTGGCVGDVIDPTGSLLKN
jgi:hypothetical protein